MNKEQARIQEIRTRANAATGGIWKTSKKQVYSPGVQDVVCNCAGKIYSGYHGDHEQALKNAEFIANARQDIPYLLDLVEFLQRENEALNRCALMRNGVVAPAKEYEPITFCGVPIADAVEIVESHKRNLSELDNPQPLTLEKLLTMNGKPSYVQSGDGFSGWVIVAIEKYREFGHTLYFCSTEFEDDFVVEPDEDFINMTHDDPDGHFGLHVLGWRAYATEPKGENHD